uniref:Uncharacterized protein n=1 Tax=Acrobeloides nanus TaxID=290746 RepID=A0A914EDK2_9BILA
MYNTDIEKSKERIIGIDESKYICCCGCHIISCARFFSITLFLIILSSFSIIGLIILAFFIFTDNEPLIVLMLIKVGAFALGLFFIGYLLVYISNRTYKYLKEVELGRYATADEMQNVQLINKL